MDVGSRKALRIERPVALEVLTECLLFQEKGQLERRPESRGPVVLINQSRK